MTPSIQLLSEKKLVGFSMEMTLTDNKTATLWRNFMIRRKEISKAIGSDLFSLQVYPNNVDFKNFNQHTVFTKWATTEVSDFQTIPEGMQTLVLSGGLYAVFVHKGSSTDNSTFQYIFSQWLPNSKYELDNRPHFELLGAAYKNMDPNSEEEIWIPIK